MTVESLADQPVGHLVVGYCPGPNLTAEEIMYGMMHTFFFSHFREKKNEHFWKLVEYLGSHF